MYKMFRKWRMTAVPPTKSLVSLIAAVWQLQQTDEKLQFGKRLDFS